MDLQHTETQQAFHKLLVRAADRDPDALAFLHSFTQYFHDVCEFCSSFSASASSSFVQSSKFKVQSSKLPPASDPSIHPSTNPFIHLLARTCTVHSLPYYVRNAQFLHLPVQRAFSNFALALAWRDHGQEWKRDQAKTLRYSVSQVILAVADLKALPFAEKQSLATDLLELLSSL